MKIAIFHNLPIGGAKRTLYEQMKELAKRHTLYLFEPNDISRYDLDLHSYATRVFQFDFTFQPWPIFPKLSWDLWCLGTLPNIHKKIAEAIHKSGCQVALVHPDKSTQAPYILRYLRISSVYHCHELLRIAYESELAMASKYETVIRKIRKYIDLTNAQAATCIITSSAYIQDKVNRAYARKAIHCPPGVDTSIFKPVKNPKRKDVLFIGSPDKINGYDLIKQMQSQVKIRVIDFSKRKTYLSDQELAKMYAHSLVVLCTSYNEPFGLTPLEAMACGTPVLAVDEGGYRETMPSAYLLPRDWQVFVKKINSLKRNFKTPKGFKLENWDWSENVRRVEKVLCKFQ